MFLTQKLENKIFFLTSTNLWVCTKRAVTLLVIFIVSLLDSNELDISLPVSTLCCIQVSLYAGSTVPAGLCQVYFVQESRISVVVSDRR